jgi:hypothetical protein
MALHHRALSGDLLLDDWFNVRRLEHPGQALGLFTGNWAFAERGDPSKNLYRPIVRLSFLLDRAVWGLDRPGGFHLTNLTLHALNVFFLWGIARSLWGSRRHDVLVAGIFLAHPLTVETAFWVSARTELWAAVFSLPAIWLTLALTGEEGRGRFSPRRFWSLPLMALALASKETAAVLPGVLLGIDLWRQRGWSGPRRLWWVGTLLVWALYFGLRLWMFEALLGGAGAAGYLDPARHGRVLFGAAALFLNPWAPLPGAAAPFAQLMSAVFLGAPIVLALSGRERAVERGVLLAALAWALAVLVPLAPVGFTLESDTRLLYLATAAFALLSVGLLSRLLEMLLGDRERELEALLVLGLVWVVLLGRTTRAVIGDWDQASRIARSSIEAIVEDTVRTGAQDIVLIVDPPARYGRAFIFRLIGLQFAVDQILDDRVGDHALICSVYHLERQPGSGPGLEQALFRPQGSDEPFRRAEVIYRFERWEGEGERSAVIRRGGEGADWSAVAVIPDVPSLNSTPVE